MKEIKDLMYYHSEILTSEEETTIKYSKARALDAAKYLERFCLYFKLDNPDCQGCPFDSETWGVTQKFPKKDNE